MRDRRPLIAGNWKMHHGPAATRAFFRDFLAHLPPGDDTPIAIFPPAVSLEAAVEATADRDDVTIGVQNLYWEPKGAFTGELSASMAREAGARMALVGHSERRHVFGETGEETGRKLAACLGAGLTPVLCVGETIEERDAGSATTVVRRQLAAALEPVPADQVARIVLAYEPVWAIGTGRTASPADAAEMHADVRQYLVQQVGDAVAAGVPILYGGSVKPDNAAELLAAPGVDGVLVGGASLDPSGFASICRASA